MASRSQGKAREALPASHGMVPPTRVPSRFELFYGFMLLGLTGFGGVLPMAHRMMVDRRRWLDEEQFTEMLGLCQFLPGGNIINVATAVGMRFHGPVGACIALAGLISAPTVIVISLAFVYERFQDLAPVRHLFAGLAAAAAGLLGSMAVKMALPLRRKPAAIVIAVVSFVAIAVFRLPLLPTMLVLTPVSIYALRRFQA